MEFERVLRKILKEFRKGNIHYALIGGFALGALGIPRATFDLDFLVEAEELEALDKILRKLGYHLYFRTENVSHFRAHNPQWGSLDFIHAFRKISLRMLERAKERKIFNGKESIRILLPEDIIGLKVQAIANDPLRRIKELADIEALVDLYRERLDWQNLKEYFSLFEMEEEFRRLKTRIKDVK
ncbi:MAG: nucleotidyltransferase family protein [Candidatus Omnitrophica bacterium]|nr:nucleotidyltransferase family protein [Candidatus Omnitrophota bacterium]